MPTATNTHTTPTRRSAIGISLAAFAAGLTVPKLASAAEPDAELIALAAAIRANNATIRRLEAMPEEHPDDVYEPLDKVRFDTIDRSGDLTATTLAGLRAKALIYLEELDLTGEAAVLDRTEHLGYTLAQDLAAFTGSGVA
jgi:hypothetical protein